jgi:hypothetical protein
MRSTDHKASHYEVTSTPITSSLLGPNANYSTFKYHCYLSLGCHLLHAVSKYPTFCIKWIQFNHNNFTKVCQLQNLCST